MPEISENDALADAGLDPVIDTTVEEDPSTGQIFADAFNIENSIGSFLNRDFEGRAELGIQNSEFDRWANIEGYEEHIDEFVHVDTDIEHASLRARIDEGRAARERLGNAGALGIFATLSAGILDPINFVPIGGAASKAYKGGSLLKGGLLTAGAAASGASVAEYTLHATQFDRTLTESAYNVAGAAFLGGLLGTGVSALSRVELERVGKEIIEPDLGSKNGIVGGGADGSEVGISAKAMEADTTGVPTDGPTQAVTEVARLLPRIFGETAERAAERLFQGLAPATRQMLGTPVMAPKIVVQMLTDPVTKMAENAKGLATGRLRFRFKEGTLLDPEAGVGLKGTGTIQAVPVPVAGPSLVARFGLTDEVLEAPADLVGAGKSFPNGKAFDDALATERQAEVSAGNERVRSEADRLGRDLTLDEATAARALPTPVADAPTSPDIGFAIGDEVEVIRQIGETDPLTGAGELIVVRGPDGEEATIPRDRISLKGVESAPEGGISRRQEVQGEFEVEEAASQLSAEGLRNQILLPRLGEARRGLDSAFAAYQKRLGLRLRDKARRADGESIPAEDLRQLERLFPEDRFGNPYNFENLGFRQFREIVGRASTSGDELVLPSLNRALPEVGQAAKGYREFLFDPMIKDAVRLNLTGRIDLTDGATYRPRLWDAQKLNNKKDTFIPIVTRWAKQNVKAADGGVVDDATALAVAEEIFDTLMHNSGGLTQYGPMAIKSAGPLQHRNLTLSDDELSLFLVHDIEEIGSYYAKTMSADIALKETFGDVEMEDALSFIVDAYVRKEEEVRAALRGPKNLKKRGKALDRLKKKREQSIEDVTAMRDRLRGTYAMPPDPSKIKYRALRTMRGMNVLAMLGGAQISSIPDIGRAVMVHGLNRTMGTTIKVLSQGMEGIRMAQTELKLASVGYEMVLDGRADSLLDLGGHWNGGTRGEQIVHRAAQGFSRVNLLTPWNAVMKQHAGIVTQARTLNAVMALAKHTPGSPRSNKLMREIDRLADLRIDQSAALEMAAQFRKHGLGRDGFLIANTDLWDRTPAGDRARDLFRGSTAQEVDRIIVTPGIGDKPLMMSTELGSTIFQFKSFAVAATQRVLMSGMQQRDAYIFNGMMISFALGGMVYATKTKLAGKDLSDDPTTWAREMVDRSGTVGILGDVVNIMDKVNLGPNRFLEGAAPSRYASRNAISALAGPTFGLVQTGLTLTGALGAGEFTASEAKSIRRLLPYNQVFYTRHGFDALERGALDLLDIPASQKRKKRASLRGHF